jgi:hypothetical protein
MGGLRERSPSKDGSLDGAWSGSIHSFTSSWRDLRTVEETLKVEEVIFNKLRGRMFF